MYIVKILFELISKVTESNVPYRNICGAELDGIIRCFGTPSVHHEWIHCTACSFMAHTWSDTVLLCMFMCIWLVW